MLVRHGHSTANAADTAAREGGLEELEVKGHDADVELSATGREQVEALASWLAARGPAERPTLAVTSPYVRAEQTARGALAPLPGVPLLVDERVRERDMGVLEGLTTQGVRARHPEEAERRERLGKFWHQPPSGESWADVALRVRFFLDELRHGYDGERVWVFTHQAVVMAFRYVLEDLSEAEVLRLDREEPVANASLTRYCRRAAYLEPSTVGAEGPVADSPAESTTQPPAGDAGG